MKINSSKPSCCKDSFANSLKRRLAEEDFDAKRRPRSTSGVEAWYPYYAGYTEVFAKAVIDAAELPKRSHILDPWNGCGTTTRVADSLGHTATGVDINPIASLVASAKLARAQDALHITGLANRIAASSLSKHSISSNDPLLSWLCPKLVSSYRNIEHGILSDLAVRNGKKIDATEQALPPLASFLIFSLQRAAKQFAGIKASTNPTWQRPVKQALEYKAEFLSSAWLELVNSMALDLEQAETDINHTGSQVRIGDSRNLSFIKQGVDLVVTSPPYCTRIDYVINTSFELAALGIGEKQEKFDLLRRKSMGTPLTRKSEELKENDFPDEIAHLLNLIKKHPSKASHSYYFKTYAQYFSDTMRSLKEISRLIKPGGAAALVVQSSYYKEIFIDLPNLYLIMGRSLPMKATLAAEYDVTRSLAQINSRAIAHKKATSHREAVVVLEAI